MKIFERIREIFSSKEEEIVEPMREINGIPGLENDIGIKKKEIGEKKGEIKKEVRGRIERFCPDLEEAVRVLREKDISEKKEHEKIKTIVNENLNLYIGYTERLIENLKAVEEEDGRNYLNKVLKVLQDFKMQSFKAFEKTTLLIGKEM